MSFAASSHVERQRWYPQAENEPQLMDCALRGMCDDGLERRSRRSGIFGKGDPQRNREWRDEALASSSWEKRQLARQNNNNNNNKEDAFKTLHRQQPSQNQRRQPVALNLTLQTLVRGVHYELPHQKQNETMTSTLSSSSSLLDAMVRGDLPRIYPSRLQGVIPQRCRAMVVHAAWQESTSSHKVERWAGIGPDAVPLDEGGAMVLGEWPDRIRQLSYVPILKNAHTVLSNAVGDLRQRLGNCRVEVVKNDRTVRSALQNNDNDEGIATTVFTVVRDPVDRFLSATCEEMRQSNVARQCLVNNNDPQGHQPRYNNNNFDPLRAVQCQAERVLNEKMNYFHHQAPQIDQLIRVVGSAHDVSVAVLHWGQLKNLLTEIGHKNHHPQKEQDNNNNVKKVRDRGDPEYLNSMNVEKLKRRGRRGQAAKRPREELGFGFHFRRRLSLVSGHTATGEELSVMERMTSFCRLKGEDLGPEQLRPICQAYSKDVHLLTAIGIAVPLCAGLET